MPEAMQYALLGNSGLVVSRLAFGALTLTRDDPMQGLAKVRGADADALVGQALDAGINFFDTADIYAGGQSEEVLGKALAPHRDGVVIATKVMGRMGTPLVQAGLTKRHIGWAIDQSLRRLGTDWVDVYVAHNEDARTPLEETLEALDAVVRAGKARYLGFSNWSAWKVAAALELQRANGWAQFTHGQMYYSLLGRDIERDLMLMRGRYGIGVTAWSPLAGGFLSGKYDRDRPGGAGDRLAATGHMPFDRELGFALLDLLRVIAAELGASVAQVSLAWLLARSVDSVILGASRPEQLADNLGAAELVLPDDVVARLDALTAPVEIYPHWHWRNAADGPLEAALSGRGR
ncbi:aryl-alcohol dehydrogenase-like predicted oxidoreductase [Sphingomonas kyeonggiensis]|uniref:Aryl-alcohol dehydrogenase-like predicted oxidoreductase n=1 Tax=Sphingomonas kyeonggiensis TaxID=1268553 RepID=A0A7W7K406_9SPHN|nr:aldo/keto reductase [Sphingomonas kyeonggiensis]MBB4839935.1 aryl-alcohol dehydrogenase-like predicted oxidoreductase [Sphingomonas kyeonggiensis]